ncbi:SHOCT domain-containing protein [Actinoplanes sp. NPDC049802]|uniref:SHOCT domain-containing protein n=1 Tax=Actinoplanes sp. NPDC049802 TaxID=3154742 RepID=UPI003407BDF4
MGLLRGVARTAVIAGTATAVSNRVSRRQAGRWSRQAAEQQPPQQYYEEEPPQDDTSAQLEQLKQLGELKAQGVLTEQEFQEQKARILGR